MSARSDDVGMTLAQRLRVWYRSDTWGRERPKIVMEAAEAAERLERITAHLTALRDHGSHSMPDGWLDECLK